MTDLDLLTFIAVGVCALVLLSSLIYEKLDQIVSWINEDDYEDEDL